MLVLMSLGLAAPRNVRPYFRYHAMRVEMFFLIKALSTLHSTLQAIKKCPFQCYMGTHRMRCVMWVKHVEVVGAARKRTKKKNRGGM